MTITGKLGNRNAKAGRAWEDLLQPAVKAIPGLRLDHFGGPTRIMGRVVLPGKGLCLAVKFEGPAPLDLCGHYRGIHCEIDAKRVTSGDRWNWNSAMTPDQIKRADDLHGSGCMVGILLLFDEGFRCYGLPWAVVQHERASMKASFTVASLDLLAAVGMAHDLRPHQGPLDLRQFITALHRERKAL